MKVYLDVTVRNKKDGNYHIAFGENTTIKSAVEILKEECVEVVAINFVYAEDEKDLFIDKQTKLVGKGLLAFFE